MAVNWLKNIGTLLIFLGLVMGCNKKVNETKQSSNDVAYFYFNERDSVKCEVRKVGMEYIDSIGISVIINFYRKHKFTNNKISYGFCRYGSLIHSPQSDTMFTTTNIDTIDMIKPTGKYDLKNKIGKKNYIVEPLDDSHWRVVEVNYEKINPNIKK